MLPLASDELQWEPQTKKMGFGCSAGRL